MSKKPTSEPVFYFRTIPLFLSLIIWSIILIISFLIFAAFFVAGNWIVKIITIVLPLIFLYLILKKSVVSVKVYPDRIYVKRPLSEQIYSYDEISHFVFNREGFIPFDIIVAKSSPNKKKIFHFWCPKSNLRELEILFKQNNKKIFPQK